MGICMNVYLIRFNGELFQIFLLEDCDYLGKKIVSKSAKMMDSSRI